MTSDYEPEIIIYPFHGRIHAMADLYHARCAKHEMFTPCGTLSEIGEKVEEHMLLHISVHTLPDALGDWFRRVGTQMSNDDYEEGIRLLHEIRKENAHG